MDNARLWRQTDVLLMTVPDRQIEPVARELAALPLEAEKTVLHCSGSLGLEPLTALQSKGVHTGSLHPLQSFAGGHTKLQGVYMAVDGDDRAQTAAKYLAEAFGGHAFHVPAAEREAYHAAACICSNYAVTVEALAARLMSRWIGSEEAAWQALLPLFKGTADNLQQAKNPALALTGPIARGDAETVAKHLAVLPHQLQNIYCSLGLAAAELALTNGTIDVTAEQRLQGLLQVGRNEQ